MPAEDTLLLAEWERMLSGGDGNSMLASILGNPGDSGRTEVSGICSRDLTLILAGFFCVLDDLGELFALSDNPCIKEAFVAICDAETP